MNEKAPETIERQRDFPSATSGLPRAVSPDVIELADGDATELHIGPVVKRLGDADVRMLAYNGSIPGSDAEGSRRRDRNGARNERRRLRGHGALARLAAREPLRRDT